MASGFSIGYMNFTGLLLLLTGSLILAIDMRGYRRKGMNKERKAAQFMGWFNIVAGIGAYVGNWVYQQYVW